MLFAQAVGAIDRGDLKAILGHVIGNTTDISVDLSKGGAVAVGGVVDSDDESLSCAVDDDTLGRLAFLLASTLEIGHAALLIVDLTAGEGVSGRSERIIIRKS